VSRAAVERSAPWFLQAESDARAAAALLATPNPMTPADTGCHAAAFCAQAIEKSIKGYVLLNGATPALDHRPDKYLANLLTPGDPMLRHPTHRKILSKLFSPHTRAAVRQLFDLTPGGLGNLNDVPNTEYPWQHAGEWKHAPVGAAEFADPRTVQAWVAVAQAVTGTLHKLWSQADLALSAKLTG
jgi:hypothetical protein